MGNEIKESFSLQSSLSVMEMSKNNAPFGVGVGVDAEVGKTFYSWTCIFLLLYLFFPVVLPNSFRPISIILFIAVGMGSAISISKCVIEIPIFLYLIASCVTIFYLMIGMGEVVNNSVPWVLFVYVLSPFLWIVYWINILKNVSMVVLINYLIFYSIVACLSLFLFFYLFTTYGPSAVSIFIEESNVRFSNGSSGATMHVFGSLIFLSAAFWASPDVVGNKNLRTLLLILLAATALLSGRSALVLAVIIGLVFKVIFSTNRMRIKSFFFLIISICILALIMSFLSSFSGNMVNISLFQILMDTITKISEGGGEERVDQFNSLLDGIFDYSFFGAGHGVSASIIRNEESPWKYELLWISTIYHVGILGFFIYSIPGILVIWQFFSLKNKNLLNKFDIFIFSGFVSILVASNTNPYLESFDLQWMLIFPCVYFYNRWINFVK